MPLSSRLLIATLLPSNLLSSSLTSATTTLLISSLRLSKLHHLFQQGPVHRHDPRGEEGEEVGDGLGGEAGEDEGDQARGYSRRARVAFPRHDPGWCGEVVLWRGGGVVRWCCGEVMRS